MATKIPAIKRAAGQHTDAWRARPGRIEELEPANIEQAADLGAGYVILKLRNQPERRRDIVTENIPTGIAVMTREHLIEALHHGGTLPGIKELLKHPTENEAFMRRMGHQEQAHRAELAESGELIAAKDLAERLHMSPQAVSKALKAGRMFALESAGGRLLYPAFYADSKVSRRVLEQVTRALGDIPASSKWQFFTTPKVSLDGITPLQALQQGRLQAVMVTTAGFLER